MTTRNKITEQCQRLYMRSFDRENIAPKTDKREVALLIDQVANEMLALEQQAAIRLGVVDVPTCMIATYTAQPVTAGKTALPAYPIQLPLDMGVWSVSSEGEGARAYIPIKTDFWDLLGAEDEGLLEDQVGFYVEGRFIYYTSAPTATVKLKLLIINPALLSEFDPYPIPADMEIKLIERVVAMLASRGIAPEKPKG
jgi:hypothetical protein